MRPRSRSRLFRNEKPPGLLCTFNSRCKSIPNAPISEIVSSIPNVRPQRQSYYPENSQNRTLEDQPISSRVLTNWYFLHLSLVDLPNFFQKIGKCQQFCLQLGIQIRQSWYQHAYLLRIEVDRIYITHQMPESPQFIQTPYTLFTDDSRPHVLYIGRHLVKQIPMPGFTGR